MDFYKSPFFEKPQSLWVSINPIFSEILGIIERLNSPYFCLENSWIRGFRTFLNLADVMHCI